MTELTQSLPKTSTLSSPVITIKDAFRVWVRVAALSFGGPAGQIAVMHRILVEEKKWISENRFLHALNYTMLLPGPEAQQLATYIGWLLHKAPGGIMAGTLFILPGFVTILGLSILYAGFQDVTFVQAIFFGLKPAVMAIVVEAVIRIGKRALKNRVMIGIAAVAFIAIFFFEVPFPWIVLAAGLTGWVGGKLWEEKFYVIKGHDTNLSGEGNQAVISDTSVNHTPPSARRSLTVLVVCLGLWFAPLIGLHTWVGPENVFTQIGLFFSKAAVVTFGGAYAVLAYIAQEAVNTFGWLQPGEMLDGLGMAETTPGPLIQVVQFVGFMGAYRDPGTLSPMAAGFWGSVLTAWVTFTPCFLWIFLGAPYIEHLRGNKNLSSALSAITAAIVGVILNLAVWFSLHTLFGALNPFTWGPIHLLVPEWISVDWAATVIAAGAFLAMLRFKAGMIPTLAGCALAGLVYFWIFI